MQRITTIRETDTGWWWLEENKHYGSLVEAINADDAQARDLAVEHGKVVTVRNIEPTTRIGTAVARAIANVKPNRKH